MIKFHEQNKSTRPLMNLGKIKEPNSEKIRINIESLSKFKADTLMFWANNSSEVQNIL